MLGNTSECIFGPIRILSIDIRNLSEMHKVERFNLTDKLNIELEFNIQFNFQFLLLHFKLTEC